MEKLNIVTTTEISKRFGVDESTARRWCAQGLFPNAFEGPATGSGKAWLVPESDLEGFEQPRRGPKRRRRLDPRRGQHAPEELRAAFLDWTDRPLDEEELLEVEVGGELYPLRWLVGQLWNCTDCLPASACDALDIPTGSTYAQGVRKVASDLDLLKTGNADGGDPGEEVERE